VTDSGLLSPCAARQRGFDCIERRQIRASWLDAIKTARWPQRPSCRQRGPRTWETFARAASWGGTISPREGCGTERRSLSSSRPALCCAAGWRSRPASRAAALGGSTSSPAGSGRCARGRIPRVACGQQTVRDRAHRAGEELRGGGHNDRPARLSRPAPSAAGMSVESKIYTRRRGGNAVKPLFLLGLLLAAFAAQTVWAQDKYPSRPVTLVVPFPPGGSPISPRGPLHPGWSVCSSSRSPW
jgi:hypothetical protein